VTAADDIRFMRRALALARGQLGRVAPNPAVGCVIVRAGAEIADGATADGGRPHAEERALAAAGAAARGATAYVTLEPCAERSNGSPSCSARLVAAGLARVVIATGNAHAKTGGIGFDRLRAAGMEIETGVCEAEARALNAGFFSLIETGAPLVVIGGDPSVCDGPFALRAGESPAEALRRLGEGGMTRVWAALHNPLALALEESGLARTVRG
jgi:diaminohydroxyphosphoribosylaminopyrimidine deaminase/5-amino-6-(5-phosphoribosylamino)uracil reductase